jgi:asparagine synthase (glutamine-hydrolysing)
MEYNSRSLFNEPYYFGPNDTHGLDFIAIANDATRLEWDTASMMSILSYGYPLGDRTIFREIKRKPWLSEMDNNGQIELKDIPPHGYVWVEPQVAAKTLFDLLCRELTNATEGASYIYILLSGGLDSRIVAGVIRHLHDIGLVTQKVICVTWGIEDSRDVQYAKILAETYGFEWQYLPLAEINLKENIERMAKKMGAANSPYHLHRMDWFEDNALPNSVVLGGSYGDSVGRAEFSKRTVLELLPLQAFNYLGLLSQEVANTAAVQFESEIHKLNSRTGFESPDYVKREHERQAHYMRGLIAHTMSIIGQSPNCKLYQAFTAPEVYGYMWSLHPAIRDDRIYAELLEIISRDVASLPWARSNRSLKGEVRFSRADLNPNYHDYDAWSRNIVKELMGAEGDKEFFDSFDEFGVFDRKNIENLFRRFIKNDAKILAHGNQAYSAILCLLTFRRIRQLVNVEITPPVFEDSDSNRTKVRTDRRTYIRRLLSNVPMLRNSVGSLRRRYLRKASIRKYPPETV